MDKIRELLREMIGLDPESIGAVNLNRLIQNHLTSIKQSDPEVFWWQLQTGSPEALQKLIEEVVIGETWFFRDSDGFAEILNLARSHAPLHILSLPCASGEEPYTLAMALHGQGYRNFIIDAMDVSQRALEKARIGRYQANSFRGVVGEWKQQYFVEENGAFQLDACLRKHVRFRQANVANPRFLEALEVGPYDAVVFRNLSIYLEPFTRQLVLAQLHAHMRRGGLLYVAASEADHVPPHLFGRTAQVGLFTALQPCQPQVRKLSAPRKFFVEAKPVALRPVPPAPPSAPLPQTSYEELLKLARALANRGDLAQARRVCEELLTTQRPRAELFYLMAVLASARGDSLEQERHLRKAIYLEPQHSDALLQLASLLENNGKAAEAERFRNRARRVYCE